MLYTDEDIKFNIMSMFGGIFYMAKNNPQSADRFYKFTYKTLDIKFHRYIYGEGEYIEFIETEIPDTGQRKDMVVIQDGKTIRITEFMATDLNSDKLDDIFDYHDSSRIDPVYHGLEVKTGVVSIADPNHGKKLVEIDDHICFRVSPIFTKDKDGWKVLSTITYKVIGQEELTDTEAIDLLILPDMDINLPIKGLMKTIIFLIGHAIIPDKEFKTDIIYCEMRALARFFKDEELSEMIEMLKLETKNPEIQRVIEKYGKGFDVIYFDGKADGILEGKLEAKREDAKKFLENGVDEEIISKCTGISITEIRKLKRKP